MYAAAAWLVWVLDHAGRRRRGLAAPAGRRASWPASPPGSTASSSAAGPRAAGPVARRHRRGWPSSSPSAASSARLCAAAAAVARTGRRRRAGRRGRGRLRSLDARQGSPPCRPRAGRCSSTSPPPGASPARSTTRSRCRPARVAEAFKRTNAAYLKGDWTNRDAEIAAALAAQGRAGVPLYLVYPAKGGDRRRSCPSC